jgi:AraC family transcriptional regulator
MDSLQRMNQAMAYIEQNLSGEIDFKQIERLALCSEYHFRRMFSFLAGISLSEYIRRRRLTLAAFELQNGSLMIIDLAIKYGYGSADAFSRAFMQLHGISPSEAKNSGIPLKAFPPMNFQLSIHGGSEMKYRIEEKPSFHIVGLMKTVNLIYEGVNPEIAAMWQSLTFDMITELKALSDIDPKGMISASINFTESRQEGSQLDQYIGVATTQPCPQSFKCLEVSAHTWAVFTSIGPFPETLQNIWGRIYAEWFPTSNFEQVYGPELLWNASKDTTQPDYHSEIWIPVKRV